MLQILFIALGGSLGAIARYIFSNIVYQHINDIFPWGTLVINLTGSFFIGVFFELFDKAILPTEMRSFITIGFLGAYTTFSTYSLETFNLLREGEISLASLNILGSNILSIILVVFGIYSSRILIKVFI